MRDKDTVTAARVIRRHYALNRPVTAAEVAAELEMLNRRGLADMDDRQLRLASALGCALGIKFPLGL